MWGSDMKIEHKIEPDTPDEVCLQCQQYYEPEGGCRAYSFPHIDKESTAREGPFGMECDSQHLKKIRYEKYGVLYHTLEGKYES